MGDSIDWSKVLSGLQEEFPGSAEGASGRAEALKAIELIIGEETLRAAVDYYVAHSVTPETELVRQVLWHTHPWSAMRRCYEIYTSEPDLQKRIAALDLLKVVGDRRALPWVSELLSNPDPSIQNLGIDLLDQLLWTGLINADEGKRELDEADNHNSPSVREKAVFIRKYLTQRDEKVS